MGNGGALKADIAVDHIENAFKDELASVGSTMLAVPGINSWRSLLPTLERMEVKRVNLAFDMDAISNKYVKQHFMDMVAELKKLGYEVYVALWNPENKGIDDCLCKNRRPQLRRL